MGFYEGCVGLQGAEGQVTVMERQVKKKVENEM